MRQQPEDLEFNRRVGALLKRVRTDQGVHQSELARRIGTQQSAVSEAETGTTGLTVWLLRRIVNALGCELKIVIERKSYETT